MKTIKKLLPLILLIPLNINLCAQDIQDFSGTYHLDGVCEDHVNAGSVFADERDVVIREGVESDLLINIGASAGFNDFQVSVSGDSLFIPLQWWKNNDETQASFQGKGKIENDSLFLNYKAGGSFGVFECECKGKKTGTDGIYPVELVQNKIYFDKIKQAIVIDETLQNQSLTFELTDLNGKAVLQKTNVGESVNIANMPDGIYLYCILQNGVAVYSDKIVKRN